VLEWGRADREGGGAVGRSHARSSDSSCYGGAAGMGRPPAQSMRLYSNCTGGMHTRACTHTKHKHRNTHALTITLAQNTQTHTHTRAHVHTRAHTHKHTRARTHSQGLSPTASSTGGSALRLSASAQLSTGDAASAAMGAAFTSAVSAVGSRSKKQRHALAPSAVAAAGAAVGGDVLSSTELLVRVWGIRARVRVRVWG